MPPVQLVKIFVSSPSDVEEERAVLDEIVAFINQTDGDAKGFRFETWKWEQNLVPRIGLAPQEVVDNQTPEYGVYLGILGKRFGTPTDRFGSGTEQEFRAALAKFADTGKPWILFYFRDGPVTFNSDDEFRQYLKVREFRNELNNKGIVGTYDVVRGSRQGFYEQVHAHLSQLAKFVLNEREIDPKDVKKRLIGGAPPPPGKHLAKAVSDIREPIFDLIGPAYLLDSNYYFIDWNPAFDFLIARPLGLARTDHGIDFVTKLENCAAVVEHSQKVFGPGKDPLVDSEELHFRSPDYGLIKFQKFAAQITDEEGQPLAWCVSLHPLAADEEARLWMDLRRELSEVTNWSRYAVSYDKLLEPFDDYNELLDLVVNLVGNAECCADLGAGTGNGTVRLLQSHPNRNVWAVESNENMLSFLREKVSAARLSNRLIPIKDNIEQLGSFRDQAGFFDAAIMTNALYATDHPDRCLDRAFEILKPGGALVLSNPHQDTDVERLFLRMQEVLRRKKEFSRLRENFEAAKRVHQKMMHRIHGMTKDDLRRHLRAANFVVEDWRDNEYAGAVVVVKAIKSVSW